MASVGEHQHHLSNSLSGQPEESLINFANDSAEQDCKISSSNNNTTTSSTTSSSEILVVVRGSGGTEPEFEGGGDLGTNYRAACVAEDDAGSSSHSEVRSSSPGLADADADVEDSGSEERESGSESERGGTPASVMYAPNIGFPPSRSSVTHTIPTGANFVNTVKFASGSNPFAVKGLPAGVGTGNISSSSTSSSSSSNSGGNSISNLESCSSSSSSSRSNSTSSLAGNSLNRGAVTSGRWGSCQPQKPGSWNSRPIIRPSALGSSLGSGVSSSTAGTPTSPPSTNSFLLHQSSNLSSSNSGGGGHSMSSQQHNYFSMAGGGNNENSEQSVVSSQQEGMGSSSFVLRPPRLSNPFGLGSRAQVSTTGFSSVSATTTAGTSFNDGSISTTPSTSVESKVENEFATSSSGGASGHVVDVNIISTDANATSGSTEPPSSTTQTEILQSQSQNLVFVPLAREEGNNGFDSVSTSCQLQGQTSIISSAAGSSSVNLFSSLNGGPSRTSAAVNIAPSSSRSQPSDSGGFVFGRNLFERVQSSSPQPENEVHGSNGISSSTPPGASDGLFCAAIRNVQSSSGSPNKLSTSGDVGASSSFSNLSGAPTAFGDSSESHAYRKRRFDDAPVLTGEEDEINVVQISCRLFAFDSVTSSWTERGRGQLRVNDRTEANNDLQSRLIVRTKGSLRLMLNTNVWANMQVDRKSEKSVQFTANDNGHVRLFLIMATVNDTDQLYSALDWRVRTLKSMEDQKQQQQLSSSAGGSDDDSPSLRKHGSGENVDGGAMKRLVVKSSSDEPQLDGRDDDDNDSLQDYHDESCPEEEGVGAEDKYDEEEEEDDEEEGDVELEDSPLKKKRFSEPSTSNNRTDSDSLNTSSSIDSLPNTTSTLNPSDSFHGLRPTPTIRINNQEINDHDECLD